MSAPNEQYIHYIRKFYEFPFILVKISIFKVFYESLSQI